uniref:Uncharacterized protein MANES_14G163500 n=1 Tax=Rhizophora mucronata TaxID=61149 RepID=A0A2P2JJV4_RHIMU
MLPNAVHPSTGVRLKRAWERPTLPLFVPLLNPFTRAKSTIVLGKSITFIRFITFCCHTPMKLNVASEAVSGLIRCGEPKISRSSFQFDLVCHG